MSISLAEPIFCFTSDMDWAPEWAIAEMLDFFEQRQIPLLVAPDKPRFDSRINSVASRIAAVLPDVDRLGHVMGYELKVKK